MQFVRPNSRKADTRRYKGLDLPHRFNSSLTGMLHGENTKLCCIFDSNIVANFLCDALHVTPEKPGQSVVTYIGVCF